MSGAGFDASEPDGMRAILDPNGPDAHSFKAIIDAQRSSAAAQPNWEKTPRHLASDVGMDCKEFRTLQAHAALAEIRVDPIDSDNGRRVYIVTRWALTKQCDSLDELRALLKRMGVAA